MRLGREGNRSLGSRGVAVAVAEVVEVVASGAIAAVAAADVLEIAFYRVPFLADHVGLKYRLARKLIGPARVRIILCVIFRDMGCLKSSSFSGVWNKLLFGDQKFNMLLDRLKESNLI